MINYDFCMPIYRKKPDYILVQCVLELVGSYGPSRADLYTSFELSVQ